MQYVTKRLSVLYWIKLQLLVRIEYMLTNTVLKAYIDTVVCGITRN